MYATNYFETMVLGTLRGQTAAAPAALYLALYMNSPGESGMEGTEISYTGYARQRIMFSSPAPMNGGIGVKNVADITFPITPVGLGSITHLGVIDSPTGGNMLLYGEFTEPVGVEASEAPVIVAGKAQWWMTGNMSTAYRTKVLNLLSGQSISGFVPHLALFHGSPEDGGAELSGDNYQRVALPFSAPGEQVGGQMQIMNSEQVATARASTPWGVWSYTAVCDAARSGQPVYYAARTPKEIRKGMLVVVGEGALHPSRPSAGCRFWPRSESPPRRPPFRSWQGSALPEAPPRSVR